MDYLGAYDLTGYTLPSLRAKVRRRTIPFHRDGSRIIFLRDELEAWLRSLPGCPVDEAIENAKTRQMVGGA
jgi:excisionase family DNA binding protein